MVVPMLSFGIFAKAADAVNGTEDQTTKGQLEYVEGPMEISDYRTGSYTEGTYTPPQKDGYVFAGWYEDAA